MKKCSKCKQTKSSSEFYKNDKLKSGLDSHCKKCCITATGQWRGNNLDKSNRLKYKSKLKIKYGISLEEYESINIAQGKRCRICRTAEFGGKRTTFCVDHDHCTGKIRGLLCSNCNNGLGHFRDNTELLSKAIHYLNE